MYGIIEDLKTKRVTPTREMTLTLAKCCHCGVTQTLAKQHVARSNRQQRKHCAICIEETFHRQTDTRIWNIWQAMVQRATNPKDKDYKNYGARGIDVSDNWREFTNFYKDMSANYRDNLTLERIDNNLGYSVENCRWATNIEQQANKRNNRVLVYEGREIHLAELCRITGITRGAITPRLNAGMTADQAVADYRKSTYKKGRKKRTPKCMTS